jgi:hypothetical protein
MPLRQYQFDGSMSVFFPSSRLSDKIDINTCNTKELIMHFINLFKSGTISLVAIIIIVCGSAISYSFGEGHDYGVRERDRDRAVPHEVQRNDKGRERVQDHHYTYRNGHYYHIGVKGEMVVKAPFGEIVVSLPGTYRTIGNGLQSYYYCNGVFYHHHRHGYEIIRPPRFRHLPDHARHVMINGLVYFVHNDVYYCQRGAFYEVCEPPVIIERQVVQNAATTTIMIENSNGSRTPVELQAMGSNQWKGPRGEIYDGLPSNGQLKEAYGF